MRKRIYPLLIGIFVILVGLALAWEVPVPAPSPHVVPATTEVERQQSEVPEARASVPSQSSKSDRKAAAGKAEDRNVTAEPGADDAAGEAETSAGATEGSDDSHVVVDAAVTSTDGTTADALEGASAGAARKDAKAASSASEDGVSLASASAKVAAKAEEKDSKRASIGDAQPGDERTGDEGTSPSVGEARDAEDAESAPESLGDEEGLDAEKPDVSEQDEPLTIPDDVEYEPEEVVVRVDPAASVDEVEKALARIPGIVAQSVSAEDVASGVVVVPLEPGVTVEDTVNELNNVDSSTLVGSQPNYVYYLAEESDSSEGESAAVDEEPLVGDVVAEPSVMEDETGDPAADVIPVEAESTEAMPSEASNDVEPVEEGVDSTTALMLSEDEPTDQTEPTEPPAPSDPDTVEVNDPKVGEQWGLKSVRAAEAWSVSKCDGEVAVAVFDNGFDLGHEDLATNVIPGSAYNSYAASVGETNVADVSPNLANVNHGTHVAGIIGAVANNGIGIAGVSHNAKIVPVKVFSHETAPKATTGSVVKAYDYVMGLADEYNIRVVNFSVGGKAGADFKDDALVNKTKEAFEHGIVTVGAAINVNSSTGAAPFYAYPSDSEYFVSVMNLAKVTGEANDASGSYAVNLNSSSNYNVDGQGGVDTRRGKNICAPGTSILSTMPSNSYGNSSGTSMATPCVAGVLALEFAANPSLTADDAVGALYASAHDLGDAGWDQRFGHGEVDARAAVDAALSVLSVDARLVVPADGYVYDGSAKEPGVEVTVVDSSGTSIPLVRDVDFSVFYSSNVNAGEGHVALVGIGAYEGRFVRDLSFSIAARALTEEMVSVSKGPWYYDARALLPQVKVKDGDVTCASGTDYKVAYANNTDAGFGAVTVTGKGNYAGTAVKEFEILPRSIDASNERILVEPERLDYTYSGEVQAPSATITHEMVKNGEVVGTRTLEEGKDYRFVTDGVDLENAGEVTLGIEGIGNYAGSRELGCKISPLPIESDEVSVNFEVLGLGDDGPLCSLVVEHAGKALVEGIDYAVTYDLSEYDILAGGEVTVVVSGKGNYAGEVSTRGFKMADPVVVHSLQDAGIRFEDYATHIYDGIAFEPKVTISFDGEELEEGVDYSLSYQNNVDAGTAEVIATGMGVYVGTATATFTIERAPVCDPVVNNREYTGEEQVGVAEGAGYTLSGTARATAAGSYEAAATLDANHCWPGGSTEPKTIRWAIARAEVAVPKAKAPTYSGEEQVGVAEGAGYALSGTARATAAGSYVAYATPDANHCWPGGSTDREKIEWRIAPASVADAKVADIAAMTYTGRAIAPSPAVALGGRTLRADVDYALSYKNNVAAGTATVVVTGRGNYQGSKSVDYKISRAEVAVPKAKAPTYSGGAQVGVAAGTGYALSGTARATAAGSYVAYATPDANHCWPGGSTVQKTISWSIAKAASTIKIAAQTKTYTGKAIAYAGKVTKSGSTGKVTYRYYSDEACTKGVAAANVKGAGTYWVKATLAADANYKAATSAAVKLTIAKAANPLTVKAVARSASLKTLKSKSVIVARPMTVSKAQGKVTYTKVASGSSKYLTVNKTTGKVTVKKGTKKGIYRIKVKVTAVGNVNYKAGAKTVICSVTVK